MSQSEYLQEGDGAAMADDEARLEDQERADRIFDTMKERYASNKDSKVGSKIPCAGCSKLIVKKSYQTQFCSNKGRGNCKDRYWNNANEERQFRRGIISGHWPKEYRD